MSSDDHGDSPSGLPANYATILAILDALPLGEHLTAFEIHSLARAQRPRLGFATVHRALSRLCELGAIERIELPGEAAALYESARSPHSHFRCTGCGRVADVAYTLTATDRAGLESAHALTIATATVLLTGRCAVCA